MKFKLSIKEIKSLENFFNRNSLHDSVHNTIRDCGQFYGIDVNATENSFKYGFIEIENPVDMAVLSKVASENGLVCEIVG